MVDQVESLRVEFQDDATAGATAAAAALDKLGASSEAVEVRVTRASRSFATVNRSIDETASLAAKTARINQQYADSVQVVNDALARGTVTAAEAAEKESRLGTLRDNSLQTARRSADALASQFGAVTPALNAATEAGGRTATMYRNLGIQGIQAASGIATGQPILTVLIQQGHQVFDSMLAMNVGLEKVTAAAKYVYAALGPVGVLLSGAVVVGLAAVSLSAEQSATRLADLSAHLRTTRADYDALAKAGENAARSVAATSTIGTGDARTAYQAIAAVPNYSGTTAQIQGLIRLSADLAKAFGEDVPTAANRLATALQNPSAAAKKLADEGFAGIDQAGARTIERMQAQGRITEAQAAITDAYSRALKGAATDGATPLQQALLALQNQFTSAGASGKSFGAEIGEFLTGQLATLLKDLAEMLRSIQAVRDWISAHTPGTGALTDASGTTVNASTELAQANPRISQKIYAIAEANGIDAKLADLATRVAYQESRGQQIDPKTGRILTSSAGALGIGQLMPETARGLGVDPTTEDGNILGMLRYLVELSKNPSFKTSADIVGAYNAGPGGYSAYLAGEKTLKPETVGYVQNVAGQTIPASLPRGGVVQLPPLGVTPKMDSVESALALPNNTVGRTQENLDDQIDKYVRALGDLAAAGTTTGPVVDELNSKLAKTRGEFTTALPAVDGLTRAATDQLAPLAATTGAARTLAEAQNALTLTARAAGEDVSPEQRAARQAAAYATLNAAYRDSVEGIDRQIAAQARLAPAYEAGARSAAEATNATKAAEEARAFAIPGTQDYADKVAGLTAKYNELTAAQVDNSTRAQQQQRGFEIESIQKETDLIGASTEVRERELAVLKERQRILGQGGDVNTDASQKAIQDRVNIAAATTELNRQKGAMDELANVGSQAFDRIGTAITQAFATGSIKALDFGSLVKGIMSEIVQEIAKLALLNPALNALFGGNRTTISDVGGLLGKLVGGSGSDIDTSNALSWVVGGAAGAGEVWNREGNAVSSSELTSADKAVSGQTATVGAGGISFTDVISKGGTLAKGLDFITGGKLLSGVKSYVFDAVGYQPGQSIGSWVSNLVGETTPASTAASGALATGVAAVSAGATGATLLAGTGAAVGSSIGAGVGGAASAAVSGTSDAAIGAIGSAAGQIADAIPYIGAAISVITDIATGNYRGAALIATGAIIGTAILPGIGTAVGAAIGGLVDMFLPNHPKNPYQSTDVMLENGRIVAGKSVSQLESTDAARKEINDFGEQLGTFLDAVKVQIVGDGKIGNLGSGVKGMDQVDSLDKLFKRLSFQNDPNDTSNFGVAKGALNGMTFDNIMDLSAELLKIGRFADGMDQLGIKLASVSTDLTNITVASVSLTGALTDQADATPSDAAPNPLRVALAHDLPGQQFANVDALAAEIDKVNQFVNGTIPGLLNPLLTSTSQLQQQISEVDAKYQDAIHQSEKYGLDTQALIDAQTKANSLLLAPGQIALNYQHVSVADRYTTATTGADLSTTLDAFDDQAHQQRDALQKALTDEFGDTIKSTAYYAEELNNLERTLGAERVKTAQQFAQQAAAALLNVGVTVWSVRARQDTLNGDDKAAELIGYDIKAAQERAAYSKTLTDFYGDSYSASAEYQGYMTELENVQQGERLNIVKKYGDQITAASANTYAQAQGNVTTLFDSLTDYATKLQTGTNSPLSATDQYSLATSQFNAVSGAAAAGDYTSASKLTGYIDTFLSSSRAVNGSNDVYASDYDRALSSLQAVTAVPDELTASATRAIIQEAADKQVAAQEAAADRIVDAVTALRREVQQSNRVAA